MVEIIAITGGKGGTGKSTVATALSVSLSQNKKVLLVDADVDCPNDHLLLGLGLNELKTVYQRVPEINDNLCAKCDACGKVCKANALVSLKGKRPIFIPEQCNGCGACKLVCPSNAIFWQNKEIGKLFVAKLNNLDLLSGNLKTNQPVSEFVVNSLNEEIEKIRNRYDFIIVDTAAGTHCPVIAAFELADKVIAVTEPTPLGAHDLNIILDLLKIINLKCSLIVNRSDLGDIQLIKNLALKFNSKIIFEIPYSKEIANSYSKGFPVKIDNILDVVTK